MLVIAFPLLVFIRNFYRKDNEEVSTARHLPILLPDHADRAHQRLLTFLRVVMHFMDM